MIIALLIWNVLLTAAVVYFAWRQITFEKMVSRFSSQLIAMIQDEAEKSIRAMKIVIGLNVLTVGLNLFRIFKSSENENTPTQTP